MEDHIDKKQRTVNEEFDRKADRKIAKFEAIFASNATSHAEKEREAHKISVEIEQMEVDKRRKLVSLSQSFQYHH